MRCLLSLLSSHCEFFLWQRSETQTPQTWSTISILNPKGRTGNLPTTVRSVSVWTEIGPLGSEVTKRPSFEPFIYLSWAKHDGPTTPLHQPPAIFPTMAANGINGAHGVSRPLKAGIYAPIPSFFLPGSEDLGPFRFSSRFPDVLTTLLIQIFPHLSLMLFELPPLASALCFLDQWGRPSICRMLRGSG